MDRGQCGEDISAPAEDVQNKNPPHSLSGKVGVRGSPERDMLLLGAGERGEGLGRPEFVMRRRRRSVRILAILALWPRPAPHPKMFFSQIGSTKSARTPQTRA